LKLNVANGQPLVRILEENAHLTDLELPEDELAKLRTLVEWYTSQGFSGAWRVQSSQLAWFSLVWGETDDGNNVSGQWEDKWPLCPSVDPLMGQRLRAKFLPMLVNTPAEYPKADWDEITSEALYLEQERNANALTTTSPLYREALFCPCPGYASHWKRQLTMYFADHVDIFHMNKEIGNNEHTDMRLQFQVLDNPSGFVTTPKLGGTGPNLTTANYVVVARMFWVLNKQCK